ncbi:MULTISPECIES: M61 family metallopeptidase [Sphingomonas]|uniref:Peptidase M61 n=1 Tax=Sphingomonas adhaesiva TaxID=28212 RepID=A0A2A4I9Z7_9SPHN|nr:MULTISPECIES: peptidase M61 [Sphingomonas]PCG14612.1 peptidase M61 [Sphingomonas adhaesiva]PZU81762.1 MAG: peptidase M61 [Sphingomonas sp.]
MTGRMLRFCPALAMLLLAGAAPSDDAPHLVVRIAPAAPDAQQNIPFVDVTLVVDALHAAAGDPLFELPLVANTVVTSGKDLQSLAFADAAGPIVVTELDIAEDASNTTRRWRASRAVLGAMTVRYRVPIDAAAPPLALPQYEMRTERGTFSAAGNAFLLLPTDRTPRRVEVQWDFSRYGAGGTGASSFGLGDVTTPAALPAPSLASAYYMGGRPGTAGPERDGFFAAWQGDPPFAMAPLMTWAGKLHRFYGSFFGYTPMSFGVFGRTNTRNPGSGIGLTDSFAYTFNQTSRPDDLRSLLAHEMLHSWVNSLDGSMDGAGGLDRSWFGEGLAVHYQRTLPYRAGMISADDFLKDLNETAARYYTNIKITTPNAAILDGFWRDTRVRVLPYDRGSLYFETVDAQIRAKSGGKRSLDDIVRAMLATRRGGGAMNEALYRSLLEAQLGDKGIADLDAMLAGRIVLPPSNAYGPRFRRVIRPLRRYDLGFDMASLQARPKIVRGLVAGSNAALAGLRNGDEILNSFPQDALQGDQQAYVTLDLRREGRVRRIRYQPRGETVDAFQWVAVNPRQATASKRRM